MARAIIDESPSPNDLVFAFAHRERVFSNWGKEKNALDAALAAQGYDLPHWTLHDLRRTFASGLAALDVRIEVIEKLLNHVSGIFGGVTGIYQRHGYMEEMRSAVALWEDHVATLLKPSIAFLQAAE